MKKFLSAVALSVSLCFLMAAQEIAEYKIRVGDFNRLTVVDGINVDYYAVQDSAGWVSFSCPAEIASEIMFNNNGGHLTIQTTAWEHPIKGMPRVKVFSSSLTSVTNSGDSTLRILTPGPVKSLKLQEMGNGTVVADSIGVENVEASVDTGCGRIRICGTARKAKLRNVGTGVLDASALNVEKASFFVFGSGPVDCSVSKKITIYGIGPGKVRLHRRPESISNRSIGVRVHDISESSGDESTSAQH